MDVNGISNNETWTKTVKFSVVLLKVVFDFVVFEPMLLMRFCGTRTMTFERNFTYIKEIRLILPLDFVKINIKILYPPF